MDIEIISLIITCLGPLLTLLVYQWKQGRENKKLMTQIGLLLYDRKVVQKLMLHLAMDDPAVAAKQRAALEQRMSKIERVLKLQASMSTRKKILEHEIATLGTN